MYRSLLLEIDVRSTSTFTTLNHNKIFLYSISKILDFHWKWQRHYNSIHIFLFLSFSLPCYISHVLFGVSLYYDIVASSPDSKSKTENFTGATSSEHEQKIPFDEKGQVSESQRSQVSPSASQQPSTPTLNGLISSKCVFVIWLVGHSNFQCVVSQPNVNCVPFCYLVNLLLKVIQWTSEFWLTFSSSFNKFPHHPDIQQKNTTIYVDVLLEKQTSFAVFSAVKTKWIYSLFLTFTYNQIDVVKQPS